MDTVFNACVIAAAAFSAAYLVYVMVRPDRF